ncbi:hypothetical protein D3D03_02720 [Exiguobacterium sp. RIT452]|uniref:hypothetical protein n=1 Tax=Exiguobacterium sp. RIT452 TaxID=2315552 RepID=UPI000E7667A6|nr:hypothetical protein [Exiguobacterium sp. RIT452]RJP02268.1 hypothetical protein D3D03_02720 [Exiguobacterium sp. RIT452]
MQSNASKSEVFSSLAKPAQRALNAHGVTSLTSLSMYREDEVLRWHGIGPSSIPKLKRALADHGLAFKP